jgi:glucosamine 6-phosphate synthetase-like amidotransferase/phosphosugar isomerase protein
MCGISGLILRKNTLGYTSVYDNEWDYQKGWNQSKNKYDYVENMMKGMLLTSAMRGTDSTGMISVYKGDVLVEKLATDPVSFMDTPNFQRCMLNTFNDNLGLIGHTRSATIGKVNKMTAHPHDFTNVVGVHNGTLTTWMHLYKDAISDSQAIFGALDSAEFPAEVLKKLNGSYALVWYDKISGKYYFARNNDRPLSFIQSPEGLFFASEWVMLRFAMERALGTTEYKALMKDSIVENFKEETLYEFDPATMSFKLEKYEKEIKNLPAVIPSNSKSVDSFLFEEKEQKKKIAQELHLISKTSYPIFLTRYVEYVKGSGSGTIEGYFKDFGTNDLYLFTIYGIDKVKEKYEKFTFELLQNENSYLWGEFDYLYFRPDLSGVTVKVGQEYVPVKTITINGVEKAIVLCFRWHNLEVAEAAG